MCGFLGCQLSCHGEAITPVPLTIWVPRYLFLSGTVGRIFHDLYPSLGRLGTLSLLLLLIMDVLRSTSDLHGSRLCLGTSKNIEVSKSLVDFYTTVRDQESNVASTAGKLNCLLDLLEGLQRRLDFL